MVESPTIFTTLAHACPMCPSREINTIISFLRILLKIVYACSFRSLSLSSLFSQKWQCSICIALHFSFSSQYIIGKCLIGKWLEHILCKPDGFILNYALCLFVFCTSLAVKSFFFFKFQPISVELRGKEIGQGFYLTWGQSIKWDRQTLGISMVVTQEGRKSIIR